MSEGLYRELKPDIEVLADPLFDFSEQFLPKNHGFLPHGAVLTASREVRVVMAEPRDTEDELVSSAEVLPMLHDALRATAEREDLIALAVCEDVRITTDDLGETAAIKVLVEHQRGLCVALYVPYARFRSGEYEFVDAFAMPAIAEVCAWGNSGPT